MPLDLLGWSWHMQREAYGSWSSLRSQIRWGSLCGNEWSKACRNQRERRGGDGTRTELVRGRGSHLGTRDHEMVRRADVSWHVSLLLQGEVVHSRPQLSRPSPLLTHRPVPGFVQCWQVRGHGSSSECSVGSGGYGHGAGGVSAWR